jgi:hypothetical protein
VVIAIVRFVRPWKPRSKTIDARPAGEGAGDLDGVLVGLAPLLTSSDLWSPPPRQGDSSASRRHVSTYGSYIATMKHWCRYRSACSWIAATTSGAPCPKFRQPSPPAKSMNVVPSASSTRAPLARAATIGGVATAPDTYFCRRSATALAGEV